MAETTPFVAIRGPKRQPVAGRLSYLSAVQAAIDADLRERLSQIDIAGLTLRARAGAGALLTPDAATQLAAAARAAALSEISLPLPPASLPALPPSAAARFVVESGADLLALALHPDAGIRTRTALAGLSLDPRPMATASWHFTQRESEVVIIGLTDSDAWRYLEDQVACRVRVFADADATHAGLAGMLLRDAGAAQWLDWLRPLGNAVFLNARSLWAGRRGPTAADFFWAELGQPAAIKHAGLRRLTRLAGEAGFPIILGGPSLVGGALYALVEAAWRAGPDFDRGYQIVWT